MSSSTNMVASTEYPAVPFRRFVRRLEEHGWVTGQEVMHLSPIGDDADWTFSDRDKATVQFQHLDERGTYSGVRVRHEDSGGWAFIRFDVEGGQFHADWGTDCPVDAEWPRMTNLEWAVTNFQLFMRLAQLTPLSIEIFVDL